MGSDFLSTVEDKRHFVLDPRTKLLLLIVISTIMLGSGNTATMSIVKLILSVVPFLLLLSEQQIKMAVKYLGFYMVCFVLERMAVSWTSGMVSFILLAVSSIMTKFAPGIMTGTVLVNEKNVSNQPLYETANQIGSVFQNPRSQFFNVDTTSEITFGCENLGVPEDEIAVRLQKVTEDFNLKNLLGRNIFQLSGGQKQKIACAGISIMHPDIFVLDEPSSNMDARSIHELQEILLYWKRHGKTIVISEHRLYYLRGVANRFQWSREIYFFAMFLRA